MIKRSLLLMALTISVSFPASAGINKRLEESGQYWQRVHTSSALYLRGPKAQQMLNRDIARCVVELRELERLGAVRDAIPEYAANLVLSEDEARIAGWDTPERDEDLFVEHADYTDFEGCMLYRGWERIKYVPFDVAEQARENYKEAHSQYKTEAEKKKYNRKVKADYSNLND